MVVLAASVCTRGGKPVLSRQFRDLPKARIEALLASFPGLMDTASGAQHTTIETDSVRYVYQPLEELYMVLITNRASNILQDIATLHLFAQIVTATCKASCSEQEILRSAFDLITAFDEVCTLGYRENVNLAQVRNFLEMDSHEERIQEIIERNKEQEATEERKKRAKQLDAQRKEMQRRAQGGGGSSSMGQGGSGGFGNDGGIGQHSYAAQHVQQAWQEPAKPAFESRLSGRAAPKGKGMALGKKSKQATLLNKLGGEEQAGLMDEDA